LQYP